jgi:hypothetical protein
MIQDVYPGSAFFRSQKTLDPVSGIRNTDAKFNKIYAIYLMIIL